MPGPLSALRGDELLKEYDTYDQHVDVVSIMQWVMTQSRELPATVRHFERFPTIQHQGKTLTPDFTVLFDDGTAIVGEIASVARHENSINKLVSQLGNYHDLASVPSSATTRATVTALDVLLFVPMNRGQRAFQRIHAAMADPDHEYAPARPPVVAQFARTDSEYTLQRLIHPDNGTLTPGNREHHIGTFLDNDMTVKADYFAQVKVDHRFINDTPSSLYVATHLVMQTLPSEYFGQGDQIEVVPADLATLLRQQFGGGVKAADIKLALGLLQSAGYARDNNNGTWTVTLRPVTSRTESDVHRIIIQRATKKTPSVIDKLPRPKTGYEQISLFDLDE